MYTLCSLKSRGGLNPNLVKLHIPHLETVAPTHLLDLSPEGLLNLCHSHIILILLSLVLSLLSLLQFLLQCLYVILICSKLLLDLTELLALSLYLLYRSLQSSLSALLLPVNFDELDIQLLDLLLRHLEGLHSSNTLGFFIFHLPVGAVHQLLGFVCSLDSLSRKEVQQF